MRGLLGLTADWGNTVSQALHTFCDDNEKPVAMCMTGEVHAAA